MSSSQMACPACGNLESTRALQIGEYEIRRCVDCGLGFVPPQPLNASVNYDELYTEDGHFHAHVKEVADLQLGTSNRFSRARETALREIRQLRPRTLLEVGCGVGNFLAVIEKIGIESYGTDVSATAIQLAATHLKSPLHHGILAPEVFPGKQFDVACTWEVLEHIEQVIPFVKSIYDRLGPGGIFYLSTPNYQSHWMWRDIPNDPRGQPPIHVTYWTKRALGQLLSRIGFQDVSVRYCSIPLSAALRAVGAFSKPAVYVEAILRPSQRRTLLAKAIKPAKQLEPEQRP